MVGTSFLISKKSNTDRKEQVRKEQVSEEFAKSFWTAKINTLEKPWSHLDFLKVDQEMKNQDMIEIQKGKLKYYTLSELYNKRVEVRMVYYTR